MMINHHIEEEELLTSASFHSDIQINSFSSYSSKVNWFVFCLICTFTLGKWVYLFYQYGSFHVFLFFLILKDHGLTYRVNISNINERIVKMKTVFVVFDKIGVWCELPFMVDELAEGWRLLYLIVDTFGHLTKTLTLEFKIML